MRVLHGCLPRGWSGWPSAMHAERPDAVCGVRGSDGAGLALDYGAESGGGGMDAGDGLMRVRARGTGRRFT